VLNHTSQILIVDDIAQTLESLVPTLPLHSARIIKNEEKEEFLMAQTNAAIKEAYIASNTPKYILLCGTTFRHEAQNALLKVLEEPPSNVIFILITTSKSAILPTILSRMPHKYQKGHKNAYECPIDASHLDLKEVYLFLKEHQKVTKNEAKMLVESILLQLNQKKIHLSTKELDVFSSSIKLLDLNSRPINVLTTLLLSLSQMKR
jgi:DNA polymerase-3 subunit delta'